MKTNSILQTLTMLFFVFTANAQQGINYKAIIKDGQGNAIVNTEVTVQFSILDGTTNVYQETHNPTTDASGIIIVNIGEGTVVSGDFSSINWGSTIYSLKTEINTGGGLTDMGTTEFKTVPYALHALSSSGGVAELNDLSDAKTGGGSIFFGIEAGLNDDGTDNHNIAIGQQALYSNTNSVGNIAIGYSALLSTNSGYSNTAIGLSTLRNNISGWGNTAIGQGALFSNLGNGNAAIGYSALSHNTSGNSNIAIGLDALDLNETGGSNIAIGGNALRQSTDDYNIAIGSHALNMLTSGSNNIGIGNQAQVPSATGSNQVRIGNGNVTYAGVEVAWTITSDVRFKENIRSLPYGLDMLMQLKPVDYTRMNNKNKTREMGFIAQDFEKVLNEMGYSDLGLLTIDDDGYLHLRYNDFIALLTKSVQEQQAIINSLNDKLEKQEKNIKDLNEELDQLNFLVNRIKVFEEDQRVAEK